MYIKLMILFLSTSPVAFGQPGKCDQTPVGAKVLTPSEGKDVPYKLSIDTKGNERKYIPDQTYVLTLETKNSTRPFREFMITVEDPEVDKNPYQFEHQKVDVGSLKTLGEDAKARYSERCYSSVENTDTSDKDRIQTHWVAPKFSNKDQKIRFRAMVAENKEVWYIGGELVTTVERDDAKPIDSPPLEPVKICNLCSEARYEVVFNGRWSRGSHPRHYPSKPDDNGYSHMIGASHSLDYVLWQRGVKASSGLKLLAEEADISVIERDIIKNMSAEGGTRTLIRGVKRHHPHMSEPSHSLLRVDKIHHLFSIVVAMKPSPDWFLGTTMFELCRDVGWLKHAEIPLYPWDAGTMDGISYDSPKSVTQPEDVVERVAVGSFNRDSPFYQMNLNDLKPFAELEVRLLDVYPLVGVDCNDEGEDSKTLNTNDDEESAANESNDEPLVAESRQGEKKECLSEWSDWSSCVPDDHDSFCGIGTQIRVRYEEDSFNDGNGEPTDSGVGGLFDNSCKGDASLLETQQCYVNCSN